ncbi:hypothetical protein [Microbispora sp. NPDC049125]|uniref:hypothetical protein n=1 Tax=Microbispora sp. NPDC049125 TaxID=3154929 RepID=UPI003466B5D1
MEDQIQTLRVRQAVLRYVTTRRTGTAGIARVNRLARLPAEQRRQPVAELVAEATHALDMEPAFAAHLRSMLPDLLDDPSVEQLDAWLELAHLIGDPDFREGVREAFERHATDRSSGPPDTATAGHDQRYAPETRSGARGPPAPRRTRPPRTDL